MDKSINNVISGSSSNKATMQNIKNMLTLNDSIVSNYIKGKVIKEESVKILDDDSVTELLSLEPSLSSTISDCENSGILNSIKYVYNLCEKIFFIQQEPVKLGMEVELFIDTYEMSTNEEITIIHEDGINDMLIQNVL